MISSSLRFKRWYELLVRVEKVVKQEEVLDSEKLSTQLLLKWKPRRGITYGCWGSTAGILEGSGCSTCLLQNVPFSSGRKATSETLRCIDYMGVQNVVSARHGFTNVVENVPGPQVHEVVYENEISEKCWKWMVQTEQKASIDERRLCTKFSSLVSWCGPICRDAFFRDLPIDGQA